LTTRQLAESNGHTFALYHNIDRGSTENQDGTNWRYQNLLNSKESQIQKSKSISNFTRVVYLPSSQPSNYKSKSFIIQQIQALNFSKRWTQSGGSFRELELVSIGLHVVFASQAANFKSNLNESQEFQNPKFTFSLR
jgi:hypothetical protein